MPRSDLSSQIGEVKSPLDDQAGWLKTLHEEGKYKESHRVSSKKRARACDLDEGYFNICFLGDHRLLGPGRTLTREYGGQSASLLPLIRK
jgi:hypothetical protein